MTDYSASVQRGPHPFTFDFVSFPGTFSDPAQSWTTTSLRAAGEPYSPVRSRPLANTSRDVRATYAADHPLRNPHRICKPTRDNFMTRERCTARVPAYWRRRRAMPLSQAECDAREDEHIASLELELKELQKRQQKRMMRAFARLPGAWAGWAAGVVMAPAEVKWGLLDVGVSVVHRNRARMYECVEGVLEKAHGMLYEFWKMWWERGHR
jgi:hypothetical protein